MTPPLRHSALALILFLAPAVAAAAPIFPVTNQGALARSFALPALGDDTVLAPGVDGWRTSLDWTNEFAVDETATASESITLDGETERLAFDWRRGIAPGFEVSAEVPLLITGGGVMDGPIESWHRIWGLPNGGRNEVPEGRYQFQYIRNGRSLLDVDTATAGLGDIQFGAGWQAAPELALRGMIKLPTGDGNRLLGGNAGGALWADYDPFAGSRRWTGFLSAGDSMNGDSAVLPEQQHRNVVFAGGGAGYRLFSRWLVLGQLYGHSQLYDDSSLKPLRRDGLQLALGGRCELSARSALNFGFQEDLITESSPDFSIHLDYAFR